mgnify:CR=1 FL=1
MLRSRQSRGHRTFGQWARPVWVRTLSAGFPGATDRGGSRVDFLIVFGALCFLMLVACGLSKSIVTTTIRVIGV